MSKHAFKKGFTLIELLVVLTILGIVFSIGYANFRDYSRKQVLESFARQFRSDIRLAQENAIAGKKPEGCTVLDGYLVEFTENLYSVIAVCSPAQTFPIAEVFNPTGITTSPSYFPMPSFTFKALSSGVTFSNEASAINGFQNIILSQVNTSNTVTITVTSGGEIK
jgi:prepilin-type N-terminal cleavage/methylation domain-containing protein